MPIPKDPTLAPHCALSLAGVLPEGVGPCRKAKVDPEGTEVGSSSYLHSRQLNRKWLFQVDTSSTPPWVLQHLNISVVKSPGVKTVLVTLFHSCLKNLLNLVHMLSKVMI